MAEDWLELAADLPEHEAVRLVMTAMRVTRSELATGRSPTTAELADFQMLLARRRKGEPLQHIEGTVDFGPLTLRIDARALIPRPETEQLFERVVAAVNHPDVIIDIGTGSGCLALALKHTFPDAQVHGVEIDSAALSLAIENGTVTGLDVSWHEGDLFNAVPAELAGDVDLIVANPPYVALHETIDLPPEVRLYEPTLALFGGVDGLDILRRIASDAVAWLRPGGLIACEIGHRQGRAGAELFARFEPDIVKDLAGRDRFVIGIAPKSSDYV